jgi:hypothetical protein
MGGIVHDALFYNLKGDVTLHIQMERSLLFLNVPS